MGVSIIIPTLNEARCLKRTLRCLSILHPAPQEVLIVDGGSHDGTVAIATQFSTPHFPIKILQSHRAQRSIQMNLGAQHASGEYLCFVHGDTLVPDDLVALVEKTLGDGAIACGGFISLMAGTHTTRWGIILHNSLKTYYAPLIFRPHLFFRHGLRLLFGDQAMFCRREDFLECGGFDVEMPIMEEADLCLKLCRFGRIRQLNRVVQSSDRRVAHWGPLKANFIYLMIGFLWGFGVPAKTLKRFYDEVR